MRARAMPGAPRYSSAISNGSACPCQPGTTLTNAVLVPARDVAERRVRPGRR